MPHAVRRPKVFAAVAAVAAALAIAPQASIDGGDWPQWLGPERNGVSTEKLAERFAGSGPSRVWKRSVGAGFSAPVVAGGKLYLFHRVNDQAIVDCMDAMTGKVLWSSPYRTDYRDDFGFDPGPRSTPTISAGKVFTLGAEGIVQCLDAASGKRLWRVDVRERFASQKGFFGYACSPLVEGKAVLLNVGGRFKSKDGKARGAGVVAFDRDTGDVLWTAATDEDSYSSPVAATIDKRRLAVFFTRRGLLGVDLADGTPSFDMYWRARIKASVNAATPIVVGSHIFISASYRTGAVVVQAKDGKLKKVWEEKDVLSNHYASSVYHDGFLYGFDGRQEYGTTLRCVEFLTGKPRWGKEGLGAGSVLIAGTQLVVLKEDGELVLAPASASGFEPTARARILPATVRAMAALSNGRLYARNEETLVCVDLRPSG